MFILFFRNVRNSLSKLWSLEWKVWNRKIWVWNQSLPKTFLNKNSKTTFPASDERTSTNNTLNLATSQTFPGRLSNNNSSNDNNHIITNNFKNSNNNNKIWSKAADPQPLFPLRHPAVPTTFRRIRARQVSSFRRLRPHQASLTSCRPPASTLLPNTNVLPD